MKENEARIGRPRSEQAREAVLRAVDDLLVEQGYAAMTMKGIAERAGVGRQTVYRWWSTKAEILLEASAADAREELAVRPRGTALRQLTVYVEALTRFLTASAAGAAYRALLGEAQHDAVVAELLAGSDILGSSARAALVQALGTVLTPRRLELATTLLVGPALYQAIGATVHGPAPGAGELARSVLRALDLAS